MAIGALTATVFVPKIVMIVIRLLANVLDVKAVLIGEKTVITLVQTVVLELVIMLPVDAILVMDNYSGETRATSRVALKDQTA